METQPNNKLHCAHEICATLTTTRKLYDITKQEVSNAPSPNESSEKDNKLAHNDAARSSTASPRHRRTTRSSNGPGLSKLTCRSAPLQKRPGTATCTRPTSAFAFQASPLMEMSCWQRSADTYREGPGCQGDNLHVEQDQNIVTVETRRPQDDHQVDTRTHKRKGVHHVLEQLPSVDVTPQQRLDSRLLHLELPSNNK